MHANQESRPIWHPMRVKTPWIDALNESREPRVSASSLMSTPMQLDLTPKEIQDSAYKAVCVLIHSFLLNIPSIMCRSCADTIRTDSSTDKRSMASGYLSQCLWAYPVRGFSGFSFWGFKYNIEPARSSNLTRNRLGTLMKDLDALAGIVANRHTGDGVTTVTAAVDRIVVDNPLMEITDLEISGKITYTTGRSSMEISCQVAKARLAGETAQPDDVLITCTFTMVSLDPITKK